MIQNVLKQMREEQASSFPITNIRINLVNHEILKATASCKIADMIYLTGMKVMYGKNGRFVSMPSFKDNQGEYRDVYFPASKEVRDALMEVILKKYDEAVAQTP